MGLNSFRGLIMIVFCPSYYKKFKCIAQDCSHSCCVGWEICVDKDTIKKYSHLDCNLCSHINSDSGVIMLCEDGRCPFLCDDGLCRIISRFGDEYISSICREHPRFYHRVGDRAECGIGMSCEEAARIILTSDDYQSFFSIDKKDVEIGDESDFDTLIHREKIYSILKNRNLPLSERLANIREKYFVFENLHTVDEWNALLSELEYLDEEHREIISIGKKDCREEISPYLERFFAYLVFRHMSVAKGYESLRSKLGFCFLLLSVLENNTSEKDIDLNQIAEFARIISEEIEYSDDNTDALCFEFEAEFI